MEIIRKINSFIKWWDAFEGYLIGILLGSATLIIFVEVIRRYFFQCPSYWAEEITRYMIIFAVFVGASLVAKKKEHIRMSVITDCFSERNRNIIELITTLLALFFSIFILISGLQLVIDVFSVDSISETPLETPMYIPFLAVPLGGLLLSLRFLGGICDVITFLTSDRKEKE